MVISNIIGGLGNQMFQYAAGRALSLRRGQSFHLDVSGFSCYQLHQGFELQKVFDCAAELTQEEGVRRILGWQNSNVIKKVLAYPLFAMFRRSEYVVEPHFNYWDGLERVPNNCYLVGYWQSEKYFLDFQFDIRRDFSFKVPLSGVNAELAKDISSTNSVSIHVRRGDYVANLKANRTHGTCAVDYYENAIRYIADRVISPQFFIFSDDIDWVRRNLPIDGPCQYVGHNQGGDSFNDMHLMSLCKHQIIANSSFSWWGAWLNASTDKIVVAPKRWFAIERNTADLLPDSWVAL